MLQSFLLDWCYGLKNFYVDYMGLSCSGLRGTCCGIN